MTISDTGIGISDANLGRLFRPFERLAAEHADVEGNGLALARAKRLITDMGGVIGGRSTVGEGSAFWIELRRTDASFRADAATTPPAGEKTPPGGAPAGTARTVLYIEDNQSNVRLMEQIVARRPETTLLIATQGRIGLDLASAHHPDLILLDLHLPDISGEDVLQRLRAMPGFAGTPIVILSADATAGQPKRLTALGATGYLTKPFDVPRILSLLDDVVDATRPHPTAAHHHAMDDDTQEPRNASGSATGGPTIPVDTTALSTFVHDMVNLLGVILTYDDLLISVETAQSKLRQLEQQRHAAEQAVELTQHLRQFYRPADAGG